MKSVKKTALYLILSALVLLSGCGQVVGEALGEALGESFSQMLMATFTRGVIGMGFGQAYHHETGQWPQSVEQIRDYCIETEQGNICKLLDDYEQIRFEPSEVDPNAIDYEIVFADGGKVTGLTQKQDYPKECTFKDVVQAHLVMGAEIIEHMDKKDAKLPDGVHLEKSD
jgi:hypothetical protein